MMSGRSLGLTGGTLDKLEAIPGFRVRLSKKEAESQALSLGAAMFGQSDSICPVDRKLYSLRDATGSVDSRPLVVSSILSKKLTEGLSAIVFDVKVGRGNPLSPAEAVRLAGDLVRVARGAGLRACAVLTRMEEPLGRAVGNAVEVEQAWNILSGRWEGLEDYMEVTLELLAQMLRLGGLAKSRAEALRKAREALNDGRAMGKFQAMLAAQGVSEEKARAVPQSLPKPRRRWILESPREGWVAFVHARLTAEAILHLGALRRRAEDSVDFAAGVRLFKKRGETIRKGEALAELATSAASGQECRIAQDLLLKAYRFSRTKPGPISSIIKNVG